MATSHFPGGTGGGTIGGSISGTQIAVGASADTLAGSANLTWDGTTELITGSANSLGLAGAATTVAPSVIALGSDANIGIWLKPKGVDGPVVIGSAYPWFNGGLINFEGPATLIVTGTDGITGPWGMVDVLSIADGGDAQAAIKIGVGRGSWTARTHVNAGDVLAGLSMVGYGTTDFQDGVRLLAFAEEDFTDTSAPAYLDFQFNGSGESDDFSVIRMDRTGLFLLDGAALKTDTTTAHTALIQAYDVDGTAYKTFGTLTNGNTPNFTVAPPAGGTVTLQATTYKSSDGSTGATGSANNTNTLTIKNGLVTAIT